MQKLFTENVLCPDGWMRNVTIAIARDGTIKSLSPNTSAGDCEHHKVVLPGVVNTHSHAFQRAMAGLAEFRRTGRDSFWTWREVMYNVAFALTPDDQKAISAHLQLELLKHGYTSLVEFHYLHNQPSGHPYDEVAAMSLATIAAAEDSGIGLTLLPALYMTADFNCSELSSNQQRFRTDPDSIGEIINASTSAVGENGDCAVGMAAHSLRAVPIDALNSLLKLRDSVNIKPVHIHIAEQSREVEDCVAMHGKRPIELLLDNASVDHDWTLVHATHLNDSEVKSLANSGATVAICPTTEANLGDGVFPLSQFLAGNGKIAIGSDSHVCISPWEELRWLEYIQRLVTQSRNVLARDDTPHTGTSLLTLLSETAARTTGRSIGRLEPGARADLIVLDDVPQFSARNPAQILDTAIFACNANPIHHVMVGGRWRIRDGHHAQEKRITRDYQRVLRKLLEGM